MPLLTELGIRGGRVLQRCHAYGVWNGRGSHGGASVLASRIARRDCAELRLVSSLAPPATRRAGTDAPYQRRLQFVSIREIRVKVLPYPCFICVQSVAKMIPL